MNASMDAELAVSSVSTDSLETEVINERMVGKESYPYRYSIWIEALALSADPRPLVHNYKMLLCGSMSMSINDAVLYIVAFFNYTEAFNLL